MKALIPTEKIAQKIYQIREYRVMLDFDLAKIYGVETKVFNQAVKRNINRFPKTYMFQLNKEEVNAMESSRSQFVTLKRGYNIKYLPYAFTEHGVVMLSTILRSKRAEQMSFIVVETFIKLRGLIETGKQISSKIKEHDIKLLLHDKKIKEHDNSINAVLGHIISQSKTKKKKNKMGFRP